MEIKEAELATDNQTEDPFKDIRSSKPWLEAIKESDKYFDDYHKRCDNISKMYGELKALASARADREMQMFWANMEVLKPAIYSRPPVPVVTSRFKDRKPLNRHTAEILERSLSTSFEIEDIHETMQEIRDDVALFARGVSWLRYVEDDNGESVAYDHIDRKDFNHEPSRKWKEVGWVSRREWLTRKQMEARFDETSDKWMEADFAERKEKEQDYSGEKKACVYEIWSKTKGAVVWVTPGVEDVLDVTEPFLDLEGFFPCPKPAYATCQRGTLIPLPDFLYYKDQIEEVNELTARISALAEALRVKGFYAAGNEDVSEAIETAIKQMDNQAIMIPVPNFAALGGAGLKDAIVWLPVAEIANVIVQLIALRKQVIEDIYQITGLSDIMRGETDANETLGAQQLKSQYGSVRIRDKQESLIRIARDMTRRAGEIMAENFQMETLMALSQYDEVPPQAQIDQQVQQIQAQAMQAMENPEIQDQARQNPEMAQQKMQEVQQQIAELQETVTIEKVGAFLQDQRMRPFALEIETDSTIQPDENANKQRVTEFLGALAGAMAQLAPMIGSDPKTAPFAGEVLKFAVAPFRAGRALEAAIDDFIERTAEKAQQPQPNPEAEKIKAEMEGKKAEMQLKAKEVDGKLKVENDRLAFDKANAQEKNALEKINILASTNDPEAAIAVSGLIQSSAADIQSTLMELRQDRQQMSELIGMVTKALMAPKRVIRDETGAPIGVEAVVNQETLQ